MKNKEEEKSPLNPDSMQQEDTTFSNERQNVALPEYFENDLMIPINQSSSQIQIDQDLLFNNIKEDEYP